MAKEIIDIYIEEGYPYEFILDYNDAVGTDLESTETCYFYNDSIGTKTFSVVSNQYTLTLSEADTDKVDNNLEEYVIYTIHNTTSVKSKLLSGRIHLDFKTRS